MTEFKDIKEIAREKSVEILIAVVLAILSGVVGFFFHKVIEPNLTAILIASILFFVVISFSTLWIHYIIKNIILANQENINKLITTQTEEINNLITDINSSFDNHKDSINSSFNNHKNLVNKTVKETKSIMGDTQKELYQAADITHGKVVETLDKIHLIAGVFTEYSTNTDINDKAYEESLKVIKGAEKKIWIVGDYSPKREPLDTPIRRIDYLLEIEEKIKKSSEEGKGKRFEYKRIQQRDETIYEEIDLAGGLITTRDQINGDIQAFAHCKRVLDLIPTINKNVTIKLAVAPFVPSLPSILIVDDKHLLFTIPKRKKGKEVTTASVIHFIDKRKDSPMINHFKEIFTSILEDSYLQDINGFDEKLFTEQELEEKPSKETASNAK